MLKNYLYCYKKLKKCKNRGKTFYIENHYLLIYILSEAAIADLKVIILHFKNFMAEKVTKTMISLNYVKCRRNT